MFLEISNLPELVTAFNVQRACELYGPVISSEIRMSAGRRVGVVQMDREHGQQARQQLCGCYWASTPLGVREIRS
jgi:hypothetical protein